MQVLGFLGLLGLTTHPTCGLSLALVQRELPSNGTDIYPEKSRIFKGKPKGAHMVLGLPYLDTNPMACDNGPFSVTPKQLI